MTVSQADKPAAPRTGGKAVFMLLLIRQPDMPCSAAMGEDTRKQPLTDRAITGDVVFSLLSSSYSPKQPKPDAPHLLQVNANRHTLARQARQRYRKQ
jgi:hypothetical protein